MDESNDPANQPMQTIPAPTTPPLPNVPMPKQRKTPLIVSIVVILLAVAYSVYGYLMHTWPFSPVPQTLDTTSWKTYSAPGRAGTYEFKYPSDWTLQEPFIEEYLSAQVDGPADEVSGDAPFFALSESSDPDYVGTVEQRSFRTPEAGPEAAQSPIEFSEGDTWLTASCSLGDALAICETILSTVHLNRTDVPIGWKTYTNTLLGFRMSYPGEWQYYEASGPGPMTSVLFGDASSLMADGTGVAVEIEISPGMPEELFENELSDTMAVIASGQTSIDGHPAYEVSKKSDFGGSYTITFVRLPSEFTATIKRIYNVPLDEQVVSTFRFMEVDPTPGWKTYTNTEHGFSFRYPADRSLHESGPPPPGYTTGTPTIFGVGLETGPSVIASGQDEFPGVLQERFELDILEQGSVSSLEERACYPAFEGVSCITEYRDINGERFVLTTFELTDGVAAGDREQQAAVLHNGKLYSFYTGFRGVPEGLSVEELAKTETLFIRILSTFKFTATSPISLCAGYQETEIGGVVYPIDENYKNLGYLGTYFTAEDCSPERLSEVVKDQYPRPEVLQLVNPPSAAMISALRQSGLAPSPEKCADGVDSTCTSWRTLKEGDLVPMNLLKLRPFIGNIKSADCFFCG
jgi:hypothetical protein